jgi:uncharacterized protein (TIGR02145 family)
MKTIILLIAMLFMSSVILKAQTIMNIHQSDGTVLQIPLNTIDSITYTITNPGNLATLTTSPAINISDTAAISGGNISDNGGTPITQRGVVWGNDPNPTTANNTSIDGSGTGNFTSNLSGLTANSTYYLRAYAINSAGTAYGNEVSFTTTTGGGGIVSNPGAGVTFDGYTYSSIVLGNGQEWMAENLRTTSYANGDPIPNVTDSLQWLNTTSGAWAHYDNDSQFENPYGKLYNFYTVTDSRGLCPAGWHVPSENEWVTLVNYLGGTSLAGGALKESSTNYWFSPNTGATNSIGFNAVGSGIKIFNGIGGDQWGCQFKNDYGHMWSSTPNSANLGQGMVIYPKYDYSNGPIGGTEKNNGIAVRCLRD